MSYLCVLGSQLVEDVGGVEACVVAQLPGDDFQGLGVRSDEQLLLSRDGPGIVAQVLGQLHLDGSSTRHNRVILAIFETVKVGKKMDRLQADDFITLKKKTPNLDGSAYDHDGIVQRSLRLLCELFCPSPQDDGARLCLRAALKEVVPTRAHEPCVSREPLPGFTPCAAPSALPLSSNLDLLKHLALSQNVICQGSY